MIPHEKAYQRHELPKPGASPGQCRLAWYALQRHALPFAAFFDFFAGTADLAATARVAASVA